MQLSEFCKTAAGGTPLKSKKEFYEGGDIPWLLSGEVNNRNITATKKFITQKGLDGSSAKIFPKDTVVIAMYGATAGEVGILRCAVSTNQAVCGIYPSENVTPEYLYYFFLNHKSALVAQAVGNAQPNISQQKIKNTYIPLPTIPEQKRIVAILDQAFADIDKARANAEQNLKNARELLNVTFQSAITGKLTKLWREENESVVLAGDLLVELKSQKLHLVNEKLIKKEKVLPGISGNQIPYALPKSWVWCCLGEIGNAVNFPFVDGPFGSSINTKTDYVRAGVPVLRMANVKPFIFKNYNLKYVKEDTYQKFTRHNVLAGDVLFSKVGAGIGEACVVPDDFSYGMLSTTGITRIRVGQIVINQYLCCFLNANIKTFMDMGRKAAQPFLNMNQIKTFPFPLPPLEEQNEIVLILERFSKDIQQVESIYEQKLSSLDELKKSILQKAFSGELAKSKEIAA